MRWLGILGLISFVLSGCNPSKIENKQKEDSLNLRINPSSLAIFLANGNIKLGESLESVLQKIPKPKSALNLNSLPAVLSAPFKAYGWEKGDDSCALITCDDVVYLVLINHEKINEQEIDRTLKQYQKTFLTPDNEITGPLGFYWFWENNGQRLMICQSKDANQKWGMTIALGESCLMDKLRMDSSSAKEDLNKTLKK